MHGRSLYLKIVLWFFRKVERKGKVRLVEIKKEKLICNCKEDIFSGIPCRHQFAIVTKEKDLNYKTLPILDRWKISYYSEEIEDKDPDHLQSEHEEEEDIQEISYTKVLLF